MKLSAHTGTASAGTRLGALDLKEIGRVTEVGRVLLTRPAKVPVLYPLSDEFPFNQQPPCVESVLSKPVSFHHKSLTL